MIESLFGLKEISNVKVMTDLDYPKKEDGSTDWEQYDLLRGESCFISINHNQDLISFKMMTKPVNEGGKGCQFTDLIFTALYMLKNLNDKFPCRENSITITKLEEALMWQDKRTQNRIKRGVEGTDQK